MDISNDDTSNDDTSNDDTLNDDTLNDDTLKVKEITNLQKNIIEVCSSKYISINEISNQVDRSVSHLKNRIIPDMIKKWFFDQITCQN